MKKTTLMLEPVPPQHVPYQLAVEKSGYLQGYISAAQKTNAHTFDPKFIEAIDILCKFVEEHPPQITMCVNTSANIEELFDAYVSGSETK